MTGELIEKKSRVRPSSAPQGGNVVRNYGACHAFVSIAESCGLREDLHMAFGQRGDHLLAEAMSLILTGGPMYYIEPEIETNMSRELLGFGNSVSPEEMSSNSSGAKSGEVTRVMTPASRMSFSG